MAERIESYPFKGNSGMYHLFKCHRVGSPFREFPAFPDSPGVYIFAKEFHDNMSGLSNYKVLYVGKTDSFKQRPVSEKHEKWECASDHGVSHICILDETSTTKRETIENYIYLEHDPPCNKISP